MRTRPGVQRAAQWLVCAVLVSLGSEVACAAEAPWIKLQASRFGVVSQLSEQETRRWAVQFDQFIEAIHQLYSVDEVRLPPLTIVIFKQPRDFAPFKLQMDSGQAKNIDGLFANRGTWSVIGLAGQGSDSTRHIIQHEAVHWFASASKAQTPLWFSEGLAEVLATYETKNGKGRWGRVIQNHVDYLGYTGLVPLQDFLRKSQDEALLGPAADRYYPEAWAFIHYILFGDNGSRRPKLNLLLQRLSETDLDTAFNEAFGATYAEVTDDLRRYLMRGRYGLAEFDLRPPSGDMTVQPATPVNVAFALARLAIGSDNYDIAGPYVQRVLTDAPNAPEGYELRALLASHSKDADAQKAAVDQAIALGSRDATVYLAKAESLFNEHADEYKTFDASLAKNTARTTADLLEKAILLQPKNRAAFQNLAIALLNVASFTDQDRAVLAAGRQLFANEGMILVGQAAGEKLAGNVVEGARLLQRAGVEPLVLSVRFRAMVTAMRSDWLGTWCVERVNELVTDGKFSEAEEFVAKQLAEPDTTGRLQTMLDTLRRDIPHLSQMRAAENALRRGRIADARDLLRAVVTSDASERMRRDAERLLERLSAQ